MDGLIELLSAPGRLGTAWIVRYLPEFAEFLRIGPGPNQVTVSATISFLTWFIAVAILSAVIEAIRNFDRRLTAWVVRDYAETMRRLRVLRHRLAGRLRKQGQGADPADFAD